MQSELDIIAAFRQAMADSGVPCDADIIADGTLHRFTVNGDKPRSNAGWYVLYPDGIPAGEYGSWKTGIQQSWCHKPQSALTPADLESIYTRRKQAQAKREQETEENQKRAAEEAQIIWEAAEPAESHPYTDRKGISPFCARVGPWPNRTSKDTLIVPVMSGKKFHSLQGIFPDGKKLFLSGGAVRGHYMRIKKDTDNNDTVIICEGYATGMTLYNATGYTVVVAFFADNLMPVAKNIRAMLQKSNIIIAADNDQFTDGNPGLVKAQAAANEINARLVVPEFAVADPKHTDFNDLQQIEGIKRVHRIVMGEPEPVKHAEPVIEYLPETIKTHPRDIRWNPLDCNGSGKPKPNLANLALLCEKIGLTVRYNVIKKDVELLVPNSSYSIDNQINASLAWLTSACVDAGMNTGNLNGSLIHLADENQFNPVKIWVESKPWDRQDRLTLLTESLGAKNPDLARIFLRKWMIGAVEAAYSPRGIDNSSVLVLQGEQYAGKTAWFKSLLGPYIDELGKEGVTLNPADKDSVLGVIRYWLVELGELDATFRKSDVAALKAFITKSMDELRRPYDKLPSRFQRRTVFVASVNPLHYLHDETGNRRFWTIECSHNLNPNHGLDMQQVWAQVRTYHQSGESWKLTKNELSHLNEHNERFKAPDPIEELILDEYDPDPELHRSLRLSASRVLQDVGYKNIQQKDTKAAATILRRYFGEPVGKTAGCDVYLLPSKKI